MTDHSSYFEAVKAGDILSDHPIGDDFVHMAKNTSRDELFAHQNKLFRRCVERAWQTPFYQRLWAGKGIEPGDIKGLEDISKLPVFDKQDIMNSLDTAPPFGDFGGIETFADGNPNMVMHTTSGTTGKPQVLLFGAKSREVQNLLLARLYRFQGLRPDDVVHSVYGHGMINGGHYVREAVIHWTSALFMSAGTGVETRSVQQVNLMKEFQATAIVGFADYIKRLAAVAREQGFEPGKDIPIRVISGHMGREDKESVSDIWGGAACYDWYGVGDTGAIAGEGPDQDGLYVMEDAQYLEVCDIDSGDIVAAGEEGDMVCTCLFKDDIYPIIRFNTHDVTRVRTDTSSLGIGFKRIEGFLGRSDNMVKLRGINIFPQALGPIMEEEQSFTGEFICKCIRDAQGRDEMIVLAEVGDGAGRRVKEDLEGILKRKIGIEIAVELKSPGELAELTQVEVRQKPIRLIDERFS